MKLTDAIKKIGKFLTTLMLLVTLTGAFLVILYLNGNISPFTISRIAGEILEKTTPTNAIPVYQRAIDMIKENNTNLTEVLTLCETIDPDHSAYCRIDALCTVIEENKLEQICYNYSYRTRLTDEVWKERYMKFVSPNHCEEYRKACTEPLEAVKECESDAYKELAEYEKRVTADNKSYSIDGCRNEIAWIAVARGKIEEARKICDSMEHPESRYNCYNGIDCNKLTDESRNSCITSKADLCETISSRKQESDRAYCIMQIAAKTKTKELCERIPENITEGNTRQLCIKWST